MKRISEKCFTREWLDKQREEMGRVDPGLLETQLAATDRRIDRLVYDLYELTEEEIAL